MKLRRNAKPAEQPKRAAKVQDQENPWLSIEHECDWLSASDGAELVCGLCSKRKKA